MIKGPPPPPPRVLTCWPVFQHCNVWTNGTVGFPSDEVRVGRTSLLCAGILVFELPDLRGASIVSANLGFTVKAANWMSEANHSNLNIDALRSGPRGTAVQASDFTGLGIVPPETNIQVNAVSWNSSFPCDCKTDGAADLALGEWLAEQYTNVGIDGWVFLRLAPDQDPGNDSRLMVVDSASAELTSTTDGNEDPVRGFGSDVTVRMGAHEFGWSLDRDVEWGYFIDGQPWITAPSAGDLYLTNAFPARLNDQTVYKYPSTLANPISTTGDIHITVLNPPLDHRYDEDGYLDDPNGVFGWDSRPPGNVVTHPPYNPALGWDGTTPLLLEAGDSITTPRSITSVVMSDRASRIEALAVLTVLDAIPPEDAFRPGIFREGSNRANPEILCYSDITNLAPYLIESPVGTSGLDGTMVSEIPKEYTFAWLRNLLPGPGFINTGYAYTEGSSALYNNSAWTAGNTAGTSYGGRIGILMGRLAVGSLAGWLTEEERKVCRIHLVQRAIDTYSAVQEGLCLEEGAGVLPGYSTLITLSGAMLNHEGMKGANGGVGSVAPWFIFADYATTFHTDGVPTNDLSTVETPEDRLIPLYIDNYAAGQHPALNKTGVTAVVSTTTNTMTMRDDFYWDYSRPILNVINLKLKVTDGPGAGDTIYVITDSEEFLDEEGNADSSGLFGYEYGGTVTVKPSWVDGNGTAPNTNSTLAFSITTSHTNSPTSDDARWLWGVNGIVDTGHVPHIEKSRCITTSPRHEYTGIHAGGTIGNLIALYALNAQDIYKGGLDKWMIDAGTRPGYGEVLFDNSSYLYAIRNEFLGALWRQEVLDHPDVNTSFVYTGEGTAALLCPTNTASMWYEGPQ